jgi:hypothetical protein
MTPSKGNGTVFNKPTGSMPIIFTAQSKAFFHCRDAVCEFVFQKGALPLNPFRLFEYFLSDRVDRDLVRQANNNLIRISDEIWIFGEMIADGVLFEIFYAQELNKIVKYFTINDMASHIKQISPENLKFERAVYTLTGLTRNQLRAKIIGTV